MLVHDPFLSTSVFGSLIIWIALLSSAPEFSICLIKGILYCVFHVSITFYVSITTTSNFIKTLPGLLKPIQLDSKAIWTLPPKFLRMNRYPVPPTPNVSPESTLDPSPNGKLPVIARPVSTCRVSYPDFHNQIIKEVMAMDAEKPRNVLEWMFANSRARIPPCLRPENVNLQYRRRVAFCYDKMPGWVQREIPRIIKASCKGGSVCSHQLFNFYMNSISNIHDRGTTSGLPLVCSAEWIG